MNYPSRPCGSRVRWLVAILLMLSPRDGRAESLTSYQLKVIAQVGQKAQDFVPSDGLVVCALNDTGQIVLITDLPGGRQGLIEYSGGTFTPIAVGKGPAPNGKTWPGNVTFSNPVSMNRAGDLAFSAGTSNPLGVYYWDNTRKNVVVVAERGTPLGNNLAADGIAGVAVPAINSQDAVAFVATVKIPNSQQTWGVFLHRPDGQTQAVAAPGDPLPGQGGSVLHAGLGASGISDAGLIAVQAVGTATGARGAYLWENGNLTLIAERDMEIPDFGKVGDAAVGGVNDNRNVLIDATLRQGGKEGLFLWNSGQFTHVAAVGDEMPGGGKLKSGFSIGFPSEAGQYPLLASINDNGVTRTAAYVIGADGKLTLVLKSGMTSDLGTITKIGGLGNEAVNSQGQVALVLQFDKGPDTLVLLTPKTP